MIVSLISLCHITLIHSVPDSKLLLLWEKNILCGFGFVLLLLFRLFVSFFILKDLKCFENCGQPIQMVGL